MKGKDLFGNQLYKKPGDQVIKTKGGFNLKGEEAVQYLCLQYIRLKHPWVPIYGNATANVSIGKTKGDNRNRYTLPRKLKVLGAHANWPDLTIPLAREVTVVNKGNKKVTSHGLFVELKHPQASSQPWLKSVVGLSVNPHIRSQAQCHDQLLRLGNVALFCIGDGMFFRLIDDYVANKLRLFRYEEKDGPHAPIHYLVPAWLCE